MTGGCGWVKPLNLACAMPCRMDRMMDGGVKQRPLQTQVTKWSLFFFLILILMDMVDQRAESGPQPGLSGRACCLWVAWPETLALLLPAPDWVEGALGMGPRVWVEHEGLHLGS